jgi:hypothetical protein
LLACFASLRRFLLWDATFKIITNSFSKAATEIEDADWVDDPDSRVKVWSTAVADIKGLIRLRRTL